MDIARIKQHIYAQIPTVRDLDFNAAVDMFLLENKVEGVNQEYTLSLDDYDSESNSIQLPSEVLRVNDIYYNGTKLLSMSYFILQDSFDIGYFISESGKLYFNFDIDTETDAVVLFGKFPITSISAYEDKWLACCVKYILKELYSKPAYFNADMYGICYADYKALKGILSSSERKRTRMGFMRSDL